MDKKIEQKIVTLRKSGIYPKEIAKKLGLDARQVCSVCHANGVSEHIKPKSKDAWLEDLTLRAETYWKTNKTNHIPQDKLAYLLIPKYGLDMAQKILIVRKYIEGDTKMRQFIFGKID